MRLRLKLGILDLALRIAEYFEVPVEAVFGTAPFPRLGAAEKTA